MNNFLSFRMTYNMGDNASILASHPPLAFLPLLADIMNEMLNLELEYLTEDERELLEQLRRPFDN